MSKDNPELVRIEHPVLESKIATAAGLFDQWIKWCNENGISGRSMTHITEAYRTNPASAPDEERSP